MSSSWEAHEAVASAPYQQKDGLGDSSRHVFCLDKGLHMEKEDRRATGYPSTSGREASL